MISIVDTGVDVDNILLTLAWMGEIDTQQLHRIYWPTLTHQRPRRCLYLLAQLRADGYVVPRRWTRPRTGTMTTRDGRSRPLPGIQCSTLWSLTKKGYMAVDHLAAFTPKYLLPRARRSVPHDSRTAAFITRLIELRRASSTGLSGLYVEREVQLNPPQRRPIMDALIIESTKGQLTTTASIPWTNDPRYQGEERTRFALENDRDTEAISVIAGKADAYRAANTKRWEAHYGRFPIPVWLAPTEQRLKAIHQAWYHRWPTGTWLMTTDTWLEGDYFIEYKSKHMRERGLFRKTPTLPTHLPVTPSFPWNDVDTHEITF